MRAVGQQNIWEQIPFPNLHLIVNIGVGGIVVSIAAFQAVDPGSILGRRNNFCAPVGQSFKNLINFIIAVWFSLVSCDLLLFLSFYLRLNKKSVQFKSWYSNFVDDKRHTLKWLHIQCVCDFLV